MTHRTIRCISRDMMHTSRVHFKLSYGKREYRFAPLTEDALLDGLKGRVAKIVKGTEYCLFWKDGNRDMLLESEEHLSAAMECAKSAHESDGKPPCVQLEVVATDAAESEDEGAAATAASVAHAAIDNEDSAESEDEAYTSAYGAGAAAFGAASDAAADEAMDESFYSTRATVHWADERPVEGFGAEAAATLLTVGAAAVSSDAWTNGAAEDWEGSTSLYGKYSFNSSPPPLARPSTPTAQSYWSSEPSASHSPQASSWSSTLYSLLPRPSDPIDISPETAACQRKLNKAKRSPPPRRPAYTSSFTSNRERVFEQLSNRFSSLSERSSDEDSGILHRFNRMGSHPSPVSSESAESGIIDFFEEKKQHRWLMLSNGGNDCFLNAAIQYLRRMRDLGCALDTRQEPAEMDDKQEKKENVLGMLNHLMKFEGWVHPRKFRHSLPTVIKDLERNFLYTQQDAYEILTKIFDDVIPESISKQFFVESARRRRCKFSKDCKGSEQKEAGAIHYQHIERRNQIVDLEALLSHEWSEVKGENEPRHCSLCCPCCVAAEEGHDEDKCKECKRDKTPYVEEQRFRYQGDSHYALVAFNILHHDKRVDWALDKNCDMDGMNLFGGYWKAVSVIKHSGSVWGNYSRGHYVTYTREDDGLWWLHDDDSTPVSIGDGYHPTSGMPYAPGITDMQGVIAILFQKVF